MVNASDGVLNDLKRARIDSPGGVAASRPSKRRESGSPGSLTYAQAASPERRVATTRSRSRLQAGNASAQAGASAPADPGPPAASAAPAGILVGSPSPPRLSFAEKGKGRARAPSPSIARRLFDVPPSVGAPQGHIDEDDPFGSWAPTSPPTPSPEPPQEETGDAMDVDSTHQEQTQVSAPLPRTEEAQASITVTNIAAGTTTRYTVPHFNSKEARETINKATARNPIIMGADLSLPTEELIRRYQGSVEAVPPHPSMSQQPPPPPQPAPQPHPPAVPAPPTALQTLPSAAQQQITLTPAGGFPKIQGIHTYSILNHIDPRARQHFDALPGSKVYVFPPGPVSPAELNAIANTLGHLLPGLCPNSPSIDITSNGHQPGAPEPHRAIYSLTVSNLTAADARHLINRRCISHPSVFVWTHDYNLVYSLYLASFSGINAEFTPQGYGAVVTMIATGIRDSAWATNHILTYRDAVPANKPGLLAIDWVVDSIRVEGAEYTEKKTGTPIRVFHVYINHPTRQTEPLKEWLKKVPELYYWSPKGANPRIYHPIACSFCFGVDHPKDRCPYFVIPGIHIPAHHRTNNGSEASSSGHRGGRGGYRGQGRGGQGSYSGYRGSRGTTRGARGRGGYHY
ncbi:hypothetical protein CVT26_014015 [Gymnopilus dilepis]|uniref:Uncharacterized protein n=1 Tax=Gymnopilus dilepis TaxID=231916 RepID=A0A409Y8Y5_9AGAR|nr:hypothetical protein CVT26_014015 [Gymnopilus dilepis]